MLFRSTEVDKVNDVDVDNKTVNIDVKSSSDLKNDKKRDSLNKAFPEEEAWLCASKYFKSEYGDNFKLKYLSGKIDASYNSKDTWSMRCAYKQNKTKGEVSFKIKGNKESYEITTVEFYK